MADNPIIYFLGWSTCANNNGGCEYFCFSTGEQSKHICACPTHWQLNSDNRTCSGLLLLYNSAALGVHFGTGPSGLDTQECRYLVHSFRLCGNLTLAESSVWVLRVQQSLWLWFTNPGQKYFVLWPLSLRISRWFHFFLRRFLGAFVNHCVYYYT